MNTANLLNLSLDNFFFNSGRETFVGNGDFLQKRFLKKQELKKEKVRYEKSKDLLEQVLELANGHPNPIHYDLRHNRLHLTGYDQQRGYCEEVKNLFTEQKKMAFSKKGQIGQILKGKKGEYLILSFSSKFGRICFDGHPTPSVECLRLWLQHHIDGAATRIQALEGWIHKPQIKKEVLESHMNYGACDTAVTLPSHEGILLDLLIPRAIVGQVASVGCKHAYGKKSSNFFLVMNHGEGCRNDDRDIIPFPAGMEEELFNQWLGKKFEVFKSLQAGPVGNISAGSCKGMTNTELPLGTLSTYGTHSDYIRPDGTKLVHVAVGSGRDFGYKYREAGKVPEITREMMEHYQILGGQDGSHWAR